MPKPPSSPPNPPTLYDTLAPQLDASASLDPTDTLLGQIDLLTELDRLDPMLRDIILLDAGAILPDYYEELHPDPWDLALATPDIGQVVGEYYTGAAISASAVRKYRDKYFAECRKRFGHDYRYQHTRHRIPAETPLDDRWDEDIERLADPQPVIPLLPYFPEITREQYQALEAPFLADLDRLATRYAIRMTSAGPVRDPDLAQDLLQEGRFAIITFASRFKLGFIPDRAEVLTTMRTRMLMFLRIERHRSIVTPSRRRYAEKKTPSKHRSASAHPTPTLAPRVRRRRTHSAPTSES